MCWSEESKGVRKLEGGGVKVTGVSEEETGLGLLEDADADEDEDEGTHADGDGGGDGGGEGSEGGRLGFRPHDGDEEGDWDEYV